MKSVYKGVYWMKKQGMYKATIQEDKRVYHCGYFNDPRAAAKAIDMTIIRYKLNTSKLQILKPV